MENTNLDQIKKSITDYLRGYASADPAGIGALLSCDFLPEIAYEELKRRAYRFISVLPDEALHALAGGQVSLVDLLDGL